jgi:hypothetical protein
LRSLRLKMLLMILSFNDHEKSNAHTKASARPEGA